MNAEILPTSLTIFSAEEGSKRTVVQILLLLAQMKGIELLECVVFYSRQCIAYIVKMPLEKV